MDAFPLAIIINIQVHLLFTSLSNNSEINFEMLNSDKEQNR